MSEGKAGSSRFVGLHPEKDKAWRPLIPNGHTEYSWGKRKLVPPSAFPAPAAAAAAVSQPQAGKKERKPEATKQETPKQEQHDGDKEGKRDTKKKSRVEYKKAQLAAAAAAGESSIITDTPYEVKRDWKPWRTGAPRLPQKAGGKRNVLITSALPYVNNVPHLGNIIGCVLSADVYARFARLRGHNVLYVCGTDEYGTATETKALQEKKTEKEICDAYFKIHREIYEWFNISFDFFGRTTTEWQTRIAQDIFLRLDERGWIKQREVQQLWCDNCKRFLSDRFVGGTCPGKDCGFTDARGDQCEACGTPWDAVQLLNPICRICFKPGTLQQKASNHLFLDLPSLQSALKDWVAKSSADGKWSPNALATTHAWLAKELEERCISRDLKWGTPVPKDGFREKVFYVWFDAPIGYLSITANYFKNAANGNEEAGKQWAEWWKNPTEVELVQFMGKDNVPFHTIIFPSTLLGTGENFTMLNRISTTEYLNYCGGKFSKSRGTGVFGDDAMKTTLPPDVWRYYLLVNRPEGSDTMFEWNDFATKNNKELLANLGNFCQRVLSYTKANFGGVAPALSEADLQDVDKALVEKVNVLTKQYMEALEDCQLKKGIKLAMDVADEANKYLQEVKPWAVMKSDRRRAEVIIALCLQLIRHLSFLIEPYLPDTSITISQQLNLPAPVSFLEQKDAVAPFEDGKGVAVTLNLSAVPAGHALGTPTPIFREIQPHEIEALRKRFGDAAEERKFPLDLRVGKILEVKPHPDETATQLYVLTVDCGETEETAAKEAASAKPAQVASAGAGAEGAKRRGKGDEKKAAEHKPHVGPRTIVSGLRAHYQPADLLGKHVVVVTNIKAAEIKKVASQGMVLTGVSKDGKTGIVTTDQPIGTRIVPRGVTVEPVKEFNIRKELGKLGLKTRDKGACYFGEVPLEANGAPIVAEKVGADADVK